MGLRASGPDHRELADGSTQHGFGFVVGEATTTLHVTADHVVRALPTSLPSDHPHVLLPSGPGVSGKAARHPRCRSGGRAAQERPGGFQPRRRSCAARGRPCRARALVWYVGVGAGRPRPGHSEQRRLGGVWSSLKRGHRGALVAPTASPGWSSGGGRGVRVIGMVHRTRRHGRTWQLGGGPERPDEVVMGWSRPQSRRRHTAGGH